VGALGKGDELGLVRVSCETAVVEPLGGLFKASDGGVGSGRGYIIPLGTPY